MVFFGKTSWQAPDLRPSNIVAQLRNTPLQQNFLRRRTGELRQYFFWRLLGAISSEIAPLLFATFWHFLRYLGARKGLQAQVRCSCITTYHFSKTMCVRAVSGCTVWTLFRVDINHAGPPQDGLNHDMAFRAKGHRNTHHVISWCHAHEHVQDWLNTSVPRA